MNPIDELNKVINDMIYFCEIRGTLDDTGNARIENKIKQLDKRYKELEKIVEVDFAN
jgi:archaellum component FlaC